MLGLPPDPLAPDPPVPAAPPVDATEPPLPVVPPVDEPAPLPRSPPLPFSLRLEPSLPQAMPKRDIAGTKNTQEIRALAGDIIPPDYFQGMRTVRTILDFTRLKLPA
jgi:hypothetical protein